MEVKQDVSPSVTCHNVPEARLPTGVGPDSLCPAVSGAVPSPVLPQAFPDQGCRLKPNGSLELPKRKFQAKSGADTPTIGELFFTRELHVHLHNRLHQSGTVTFRKQKEMSGKQARSRNAAKTSDEAGGTPPPYARSVPALPRGGPPPPTLPQKTLNGG